MEIMTARPVLLSDPNKHVLFERVCERPGRDALQVARKVIRDDLALHAVAYTAARTEEESAEGPGIVRAVAARPSVKPAVAARSALAARSRSRRR